MPNLHVCTFAMSALSQMFRASCSMHAYTRLDCRCSESWSHRSALHIEGSRVVKTCAESHPLSRRSAGILSCMLPILTPRQAFARTRTVPDPGEWSSPGLAKPVPPDQPLFIKGERGIKIQVLAEGEGVDAQSGDTVLIDFVLRRSDGYFIYSTVEGVSFQPRDVPVGPVAFELGSGQLVPGLEEALVGMKRGAKRRVLIPAEEAYRGREGAQPQPPTYSAKRQLVAHQNEPFLFEIQLLRINKQQ